MGIIARWDSSPRGWYTDVTDGLVVLRGYVKSVERLIVESIEIYEREKENHVIREDPDEGWIDVVTVHHGIDDSTYHLDSIFKEHFPDLQRRSALITLVSFFEHQLDDLCKRFSNEDRVTVKFDDFEPSSKSIINRSTEYLKKVVGLRDIKGTPTWEEIRYVQKVRNALVHNGGRLMDKDKDKYEKMRDYCRERDLLSGEADVTIKSDYLPHVIKTFDQYFKEIHRLISPNT